jgi:hypothetical protein
LAVAIRIIGGGNKDRAIWVRAKTSTEIHDLIRQMSMANPLWDTPSIHGELLILGIEVSQATRR